MKTLNSEKDTKTALLDCAEKLFLEKGFEQVSVREITDAAGANVAAINYHYQGKTNLYRAFLSRRFAEISSKKVALLERFLQATPPPPLRDIIEAYVRSHFDDILNDPDGERLLQLVYREMSPDAVAADLVTMELVMPIHVTLLKAMKYASPHQPEAHLAHCISSVAGQVLHFIRAREVIRAVSWVDAGTDFIENVIHHITEFSLRGIGSEPYA